jgi:hypothetical protein
MLLLLKYLFQPHDEALSGFVPQEEAISNDLREWLKLFV